MHRKKPVRIDVVSDVVCPWCFIGKHRLEQPSSLNPAFRSRCIGAPISSTTGSRARAFRARVSHHQIRLARALQGHRQARPRRRRKKASSTHRQDEAPAQHADCHRLIRRAEKIGKAAEMKQKLMDLYFTQGADLTDRETLVQAAPMSALTPTMCAGAGERQDVRGRAGGAVRQGGRHRGRAPVHLRRQVRGVGRTGAGISRRGDRARGASRSEAAE